MITNYKTAKIAGLHFRFSRLLGKRALRGGSILTELLGPVGAAVFCGGHANGVTSEMIHESKGLMGLASLLVRDEYRDGAQLGNPDVVERAASELIVYEDGQGTQLSEDGEAWIPVRSLDSLSRWESMGLGAMTDILWHSMVFNFFGSLAPDTASATPPAATTTSPTAGDPSGPKSGPPTSPQTGLHTG